MSDLLRFVLTLLAGVLTGMLSGAFGAGGGVVSTPAIRFLGASAFSAVGSTLPPIFPSAIAGGLRYHKQRLIEWPAVKRLISIGMPAAACCAALAHVIPGNGHVLMLLTAALVTITGYRMFRRTPPEILHEEAGDPAPVQATVPMWVGLCAGGLSGLLGIGGGVVMVPVLVNRIGFPIKRALGTSLVSAGFFAIPATLTHAYFGGIDWKYALPLAIGVVPGSRIGSALALRSGDRGLRIAVSMFLIAVAIALATKELVGWLG
ncbi:MAG: sulfite exporter TauE/SafE family protein [Acidimicrobiia bacterium]